MTGAGRHRDGGDTVFRRSRRDPGDKAAVQLRGVGAEHLIELKFHAAFLGHLIRAGEEHFMEPLKRSHRETAHINTEGDKPRNLRDGG